jgi:hypothetical protein
VVANAEVHGRKVLYVLGPTPSWAATRPSGPPRRMADMQEFVSKVAQRYGDRIYAFEMWNEANLSHYYSGTPRQMARMTRAVRDTLDEEGVGWLLVAASTTVRIMSTLYRFYPSYLSELKRLDWPIDAFALHTYPRPGGAPDEHTAGVVLVKSMLDAAGAPELPILDTELNYGLGGLDLPKRDIVPPDSGEYIAQTFLEALRLGLSSVEWYAWTALEYPLLGLQMHPGTLQTNASWTAIQHLLVGAAFVGCAEQAAVILCGFERDGERFAVAYSPSGTTFTVPLPSAWTTQCRLDGPCSPVTGDVSVGLAPVVLHLEAAH